jgi:DNA-binding CsgD family transcriptional regulator
LYNPEGVLPLEPEFRALLIAAHWDELTQGVQALLRPLGADGFLKRMRITDANGRAHFIELGTFPDVLHGRTCDANDIDPVTHHVSQSVIPLVWTVEQPVGIATAFPYRELRTLGLRVGWSVAARGEQSFSRIDFYSRNPQAFAQPRMHSSLLHLSCYLNEAARALWERQAPKAVAPVLTARERQCLRWSASGKTSNEIGSILGISQNTVYFHLKRAASKLDVYGTRHAITRAMELRLL